MNKTITLNQEIVNKFGLTSEKLTYLFHQKLQEQKSLRIIAEKITKSPETVRVYSPLTKREGE